MGFPFEKYAPIKAPSMLLGEDAATARNSVDGFDNLPSDKQRGLLKFIEADRTGISPEESDKAFNAAALEQLSVKGIVGESAVDSAVREVELVLGDTKGFLKNIAKVESNFGKHRDTFNGVSNGIWQVDNIALEDTQRRKSGRISDKMLAKHKLIKEKFGIDWLKVKPKDLKDPLIGAIAARMVLGQVADPIPSDLRKQAVYWKKYYNKTGDGTVDKFLSRVKRNKR